MRALAILAVALSASGSFLAATPALAATDQSVPDAPTTRSAGSPGPVPAAPAFSTRELGIGALQLASGYVAEVGGVAALFAIGLYPKALGIGSDADAAVEMGALGPAFAGLAVCGVGRLSRSYRGRCSTTLIGAYLAGALGAGLAIALAPAPGPDDTQEFVNSIYAFAGFLLFAPPGALIGYHLGKEPLPVEPTGQPGNTAPAPASPPPTATDLILPRSGGTARYAGTPAPPTFVLPIVSLAW